MGAVDPDRRRRSPSTSRGELATHRSALPLDERSWEELSASGGTTSRTCPHIQRLLSNFLVRLYLRREATAMKFFFPDSQDQIDPSFDFVTEERSRHRVRQRDDLYAHEVVRAAPVRRDAGLEGDRRRHRQARAASTRSRSAIASTASASASSSDSTTRGPDARDDGRLRRVHLRPRGEPPYTVDEVIDFYEDCGFDLGSRSTTSSSASTPTLDERRRRRPERLAATGRSSRSNSPRSSSQRHRDATLHVRARRRRAGLESRSYADVGRANCRRSATSASRSAAWCR